MGKSHQKSSSKHPAKSFVAHPESSDDDTAPVFVFDEAKFGIRRRDPAAISQARLKATEKIDLDTSEIVEAGTKAKMDADE